MTPLNDIKQCIQDKKSFVLQGGAGSGKTETLKNVLEFISKEFPDKKVACITHTNLAVAEIQSRVGDKYTISTIHSFLNSIIKDYKKNIFQCIFELFRVEKMERKEVSFYFDENEQKKVEHDKYKRIYEKYAKKLFTVSRVNIEKPKGKRIYDVNPDNYNTILNTGIDELNIIIRNNIASKDFNKIKYNETKFNRYKDLTFGHDGLLEIAYHLFSSLSKMGRILKDKFDYILIDEYQDTNPKIVKLFLTLLPKTTTKLHKFSFLKTNNIKLSSNLYNSLYEQNPIIGLFGDSMQSIYKDGIGDVQNYINNGILKKIIKEDNYRCSVQVVDFINKIRNDGLIQEVQLKHDETHLNERQGNVEFYYSVVDSKPTVHSSVVIKTEYLSKLNTLIEYAKINQENSRLLMLTNKSISLEAYFEKLYDTFAQRYQEPKEYIDEILTTLQFLDLIQLCEYYENGKNNFILSELKKIGYPLKTIQDKRKLKADIEYLINFNGSAFDALNYAFTNNIIKKSESFNAYIARKEAFLSGLNNEEYRTFKTNYNLDQNTLKRMNDANNIIDEEKFKELEKDLKKEKLFVDLFSPIISFKEIINYYNYKNENINYITMHKTKGSGIKNVIVVLDEYFWTEYNFSNIFDENVTDIKKVSSQKLFYVACSRTKNNLTCIRLIKEEEEYLLKQFYTDAIKIS